MSRTQKIFSFVLLTNLFFLILITNTGIFAQKEKIALEGKVVDSKSGEPLALVNVYIAETTLGSATDANGNFRIPNVPQSLFLIVASAIGYETSTIAVDLRTGGNKFINIRMNPKTYELAEIDVKGKEDPNWWRQLDLFKKMFFGQNDFSKSCDLINPYHINFTETSEKLIAQTDFPVKVRNNALGYEIECILTYFEYNKIRRTTSFNIFPKFKEISTSDPDSLRIFKNNRRMAFLGSTTHLLSSLAKGRFKYRDEGFILKLDSKTVGRADEIVKYDSVNNSYFLKFDGCMKVEYWNRAIRTTSQICLKFGSTEFSADGYLIYPGQFEITGAMAAEGIATQLPRFLEISDESN